MMGGDIELFEPVQTLTPAEITELTSQQLDNLLMRIRSRRHGYYACESFATIQQAPVLTAEDFVQEVNEYPPFGRFQLDDSFLQRAALTTSCVPSPTPIVWTREDIQHEARLGARALHRAGLGAGGRSTDCLEGGLRTPGTLSVCDALDVLDALALPVGPVASEDALHRVSEAWEVVRPRHFICDAATYRFLGARLAPTATIIPVLTPADADLLAAVGRERVFRVLSIPQISVWLAGECWAHSGYHVAEDHFWIEILDENHNRLPDRETGLLTITTLVRSFAMIRFSTGIRAAADRSPCPCGETHARLQLQMQPPLL